MVIPRMNFAHRLLSFIVMAPTSAFAGGDSAPATVEKITYSAEGKLIVDFRWEKDSGFIDRTKQTRLVFDLYRGWSWLTSKSKMPKEAFEGCANYLLEAMKNRSKVELGQRGGGRLAAATDVPDAVLVPYAQLLSTVSGVKACFVIADPLR